MIIDWFRSKFATPPDETIQERARQARFKVNDDLEDITDQAHKELETQQKRLHFTLDCVINKHRPAAGKH